MKVGDQVGKYQLLKELGHGGMGGVWIAFDPDHNDLVAVKTLFEEYCNNELYVRRFQREIDLMKRLGHPNVVGFRGGGKTPRTYFLALEYIRGADLSQLLRQIGRFTVADTLKVILGISRALSHAHELGIIHRDIKPSNIMLSAEGKIPKILDFGVAHAEDAHLMTATGDIVGTFLYAAPEQNQGKQIDERTDIYALGLVLHELLTGKRVLRGTNHQEVTAYQLTQTIPGPSASNPTVPEALDRIVGKMLEVEARNRYSSCQELLVDLEAFANNPQEFSADRRSIYEYPDLMGEFKKAQKALKAGDYDEVIEIGTALQGRAPRAAEVHSLVGVAQREKGLPFNAIHAFKRAITFERGNIGYHLELAQTYEQMGMEKAAIDVYQTVLEMEPNSTVAKRHLEALQGGTPVSSFPTNPPVPPASSEAAAPAAAPAPAAPVLSSGGLPRGGGGVESEAYAPAEVPSDALSGVSSGEVSAEELMRAKRKLDAARPRTLPPVPTALGTVVLWGLGNFRLGKTLAALAVFLLEGLLVYGALFFSSHPSWVPPELMGDTVLRWVARNPGQAAGYAALLCEGLLVMGSAWLAYEAYLGATTRNKLSFVIEVDPNEGSLLINAGSEAGLRKEETLVVVQQDEDRKGFGIPIGRVVLLEVLNDRSAGRFEARDGGKVLVGDLVVPESALEEGWVETQKFHPELYPELPFLRR